MAREARGHPFFAWFYSKLAPAQDRRGTVEHRARLLGRAQGRVIDIGAGTGLNLPHYPAAVTELVLTEPDPHMLRRLRGAIAQSPIAARIEPWPAEALHLDDDWADTAVCSLVLCSVADQSVALTEIRRVLRPGGRLLFFEHVRSEDPRFARRQDRMERLWGFFAGGCHPNRDTLAAIRSAGFEIEDVDRFDEPGTFLAKSHVLGSAIRQ